MTAENPTFACEGRIEESSRDLVINTLGQAAPTALGCQADRSAPSVFLEEP